MTVTLSLSSLIDLEPTKLFEYTISDRQRNAALVKKGSVVIIRAVSPWVGISDKALKTPYAGNKYRFYGKELQNKNSLMGQD